MTGAVVPNLAPIGQEAPTGVPVSPTGPTGSTGPNTGQTGPTGPQDPRIKTVDVPEKYINEPWAKEVKNIDDLWGKMAGVQKLLGKDKVVLPGDNATQEEINAFQLRMGRPENAEGYAFKSIDSLKEVTRNVEFDHNMKKILFEEGIPKEVGERIMSKSEALIYSMQKPAIETAAKRDIEFQKLTTEILGEDRSSAMESFKSVMRESLGDRAHLVSKIEGMGNEALMSLIVFSKNMHDKYTGENRVGVRPGDRPGLSGDLKTDFQSLSQQKLNIKTDKTMPEHIKKMKLANLNMQMQKVGAKASERGVDLFSQI